MPVIYSYPKGTSIIDSDSVLGTDQSNKNNTVTYTMVDIKDYVLKDLLDGVQFRLPIYGKPKVLTNSLFYQNTAAETGTAILGDTVYLNNGNNIGNLIVAQNITSSNGNIVSTVGNIAAGGSIAAGQTSADPSYRLKVNGASNFTGAIIADSTITVGGVATFNAAVQANSTVNVVGTLTASGTSNLDGIVRLGGALPSSTSGIFLNRLTYLNSDTTLDPAATLALQGPIKDSLGVLGSNEQVLVSDANGKMSWQFYQSSGLEFQASWNASTDIPDLTSISLIEANVGKYWVVSVAGNTNLSGITDWQIGDWAIVSRDSSDTVFWSKIDNSASITGTGTNGTLTKWTGPTTLGDSIVSESGTTLTIAGDLTLERDQSDTTLTIISDASNIGENNNPSIKFIQDGGSQNAAIGFNIIDDTVPDGLGNRFWIINSIGDTGPGDGGITFGTAQVDGWDNAIGRFIIRGDGKGLFGHPDSLYNKTLGSQFEIYDNRDENTTTDPSFSVYSVVDVAAPSGNEGAGGIKQILDVYDNGVFSQQEALMLIPGTSASDFAASTPIAFYTNSDMDTSSPSGFAGIIFDSGNWLLDGSGTFTTVDPGYQLKVVGNTNITGDVQIDTLSNNYIPVNNTQGILSDSGFYQSPSSSVNTAGAISLNTTFADTNYGEVPGLRVASRVSNTPGVIDLFRNDASVTAGESVGILQYSVLDDGRYTVAQIGVETLSTSGVGDSGGGKFIFKTTRGGQVGAIPESRFELDNDSADFSVPINVTNTNTNSSFAGQVTIPITPQAATDAASKAYVDSQSGGGGGDTYDLNAGAKVGINVPLNLTSGSGSDNSLVTLSEGSGITLTRNSATQITIASSGGGGGVTGDGNQYNIPVWSNTTELSGLTASTSLPSSDSLTAGISALYADLGAQGPGAVPTQHVIKNYVADGTNTSTYTFNQNGIFTVSGNNGGRIDVGVSPANIQSSALNVGTGVATFKGGVIISNSPGGVQVDNSSLVVGSGTNDNISGSDHCLIVGSGNQITSNSDQSVAFGQGNAITSSIDAFAVGNSNTLTSSLRTQALGFNNTITASSSFVAGGGNSITANANIFALGDSHTVTTTGSTEDAYLIGTSNTITGGTGSFAIGSNLDGDTGNHMVVGYRNNKTSYPATDYSLGLGNTKFALAVGSTTTTNSNALLITEGGVNRGGGVAQVPRIVLPTIIDFNFADDTAALAGGIPLGGLYHNAGALRINLLGSSTAPDPYTPVVGSTFRALGSLVSSPFIGLFDSSLALVSSQPSFGALPNNSYTVGAASDSYTYILAAGRNQQTLSPRMSTDSGATWTSLPSPVSGTYRAEDTTMSKSGQVMVLEPGGTNNYIFLSNDYGSTFTQVTLPVPVGSSVVQKRMVSVSSGGKYIIVSTYLTNPTNSGIFVSEDYGATFTNITSSLPSPVSTAGYDQVVVSGEGQYQYLLSPNTNESKYSSDYGVSWTNKNYGSFDFRESSAASEDGQYVLFPRNTTTALYTDDFGATTSTSNIGANQLRSSISNSGQFAMFIGSLSANQYISTNYLSSFSAVAGSMSDGVIVDV